MSSILFTKTPVTVDPAKTVISKERRLVETRINPFSIYVLFSNVVIQDGEVISEKPISNLPIPLTELPPDVLAAISTVVDFLNTKQDGVEQAAKDALAASAQPVSPPDTPPPPAIP